MDRGRAPNGIGHLIILLFEKKNVRIFENEANLELNHQALIAVAEGDRLSGIRHDPE